MSRSRRLVSADTVADCDGVPEPVCVELGVWVRVCDAVWFGVDDRVPVIVDVGGVPPLKGSRSTLPAQRFQRRAGVRYAARALATAAREEAPEEGASCPLT